METLKKILDLMESNKVKFTHLTHKETYTSEESANIRGTKIEEGAKALVLKVDDKFIICVIPANKKLNSSALKKELGFKKSRFLDKQELFEKTGLVPGSIPPFGEPILPFQLYIDDSILNNKNVSFNAGSLTNSIILNTDDYLDIANYVKLLEIST